MSPGAARSQPLGGINSCSFVHINIAKLKMYLPKKPEIPKGRGVHDYGILRAWGGNTFWNFRRQGGVKTWKPSVVGYGYFLELLNPSTKARISYMYLLNKKTFVWWQFSYMYTCLHSFFCTSAFCLLVQFSQESSIYPT